MKRRTKKKVKNIGIILIILIIVLLYFIFFRPLTNKEKLVKKGYKEEVIALILKDKELTKTIVSNEFNTFLNNNYDKENFDIYKLDRYISYQVNTKDVDEVIYLVNSDIDLLNIKYDNRLIKFLKAKYYKKDNLNRYLKYDSKYEVDEIIKRVNSNIDYSFYKDTVNTDLSKGNLMIVNKHYYLGGYIPEDLKSIPSKYGNGQITSETLDHFIMMSDDMNKEGLFLTVKSSYRSFNTQKSLYNRYKSENGLTWADNWSARPGYSEHQTGLALDLGTKTSSSLGGFKNTKEYIWVKDNCHKYGFILRYESGQEYITGYNFESWHYRYVGIEVATKIKELGITFEEYYEYFVK